MTQMKILKSAMLGAISFASVCLNSYANMDSVLISYTASGSDVYKDGTPVKGKECYAIVWVKDGSNFQGFWDDGTLVNDDFSKKPILKYSDLFSVVELNRNESCLIEVDSAEYSLRTSKLYQYSLCVFLLDTRNASGIPVGLSENGLPGRVNHWGMAVNSSVDVVKTGSLISMLTAVPAAANSALTDSREGEFKPRITGIRIEGKKAKISVKGLTHRKTVGIARGDQVSNLAGCYDKKDADGEAEFSVDVEGENGFFSVVTPE